MAARSRQRAALWTGLALAVAALVLWYGSPHWALRGMQAAARSGDAAAFNAHVDYPKVRDSLKAQVAAMVASRLGDGGGDNSLAALGGVLGLAVVDTMVDAIVRPEVMMRGLRLGQFSPAPKRSYAPGSMESVLQGSAEPPEWVMDRQGFSELRVYPATPDGQPDPKRVSLVFERSGLLSWKLTGIRLPQGKQAP